MFGSSRVTLYIGTAPSRNVRKREKKRKKNHLGKINTSDDDKMEKAAEKKRNRTNKRWLFNNELRVFSVSTYNYIFIALGALFEKWCT